MSLKLGRITLPEPTMWSSSGTTDSGLQVTIVGSYKASSLSDGLVKRDQILSLSNNWDEPIIPVIMDGEPRVTGYYKVISAACDTDEFVRLQGNLYDYQVTLEPVHGFTNPLLESVLSGALLTNAVGAVLGDVHAFHAMPAASTEYSYAGVSSVFGARTSADGDLIFLDTGQILTSTTKSGLAPSGFYVGAATFEQGSPLQPVVGRTLAQADLVNWRLSNGLVRVTPNASVGKLDVSHYNGSSWSAVKTYVISATYTPALIPNRDMNTITTTAGSITGVSGAMVSFKPATTIALVGVVGAFTVGAATTVSPAFGQATVATHLLVAWVTSTAAAPTTGAAGWVPAIQNTSGTGVFSSIWYKPNCGAGEAAPTFTAAGGTVAMHAQLAEFSGALTASPKDQVGGHGASSGFSDTVNAVAADAATGDLILASFRWAPNVSATATFTDVGNNAAMLNVGNSGASNVAQHSTFSYGIVGAPLSVAFTGLNSLTVMRNAVEETTIRLSLATSVGVTAGILLCDISLRRGDRLARLYLQSSNSNFIYKLARNTTEAATAITYGAVTLGGIRATANDGDSNRYIILSYQRATPVNDLTNGAITQGATGLMADYAIGSEIGGSEATAGLDDAASVAQQYLAAQSESQRIVAR